MILFYSFLWESEGLTHHSVIHSIHSLYKRMGSDHLVAMKTVEGAPVFTKLVMCNT